MVMIIYEADLSVNHLVANNRLSVLASIMSHMVKSSAASATFTWVASSKNVVWLVYNMFSFHGAVRKSHLCAQNHVHVWCVY